MVTVGIDEVGRGCWAGPVVAGAVVLTAPIVGLTDSKLLKRGRREELAAVIRAQAAVGLGWVWPERVDAIGLTAAVAEAMRRALEAVAVDYDTVIIDGAYNFLPDSPKVRTLVKADALVPAVSAASIVAKVARDQYMQTEAARLYPQYGFDQHVGYGTALHLKRLREYGVLPIHRKSYKPIQQLLLQSEHERTPNGNLQALPRRAASAARYSQA